MWVLTGYLEEDEVGDQSGSTQVAQLVVLADLFSPKGPPNYCISCRTRGASCCQAAVYLHNSVLILPAGASACAFAALSVTLSVGRALQLSSITMLVGKGATAVYTTHLTFAACLPALLFSVQTLHPRATGPNLHWISLGQVPAWHRRQALMMPLHPLFARQCQVLAKLLPQHS